MANQILNYMTLSSDLYATYVVQLAIIFGGSNFILSV